MNYQTMCALRIYLRRSDTVEEKRFWRRWFKRSLATHLIHQSLRAGITHASLSYGHMGFAKGAKGISTDTGELNVDTLPACVELVAPRPILDQFVRDNKKSLPGATLVMLEGVHVRAHLVEEEETDAGVKVQYLQVGEGSSQGSLAPITEPPSNAEA